MTTKTSIEREEKRMQEAQNDVLTLLKNYFVKGNVEHHIGLLSNAIQEIVTKGSDETDESLDYPFDYTRRYIRESIYDLTEMQKFLMRLSVVYADFENRSSIFGHLKEAKNEASIKR